MKTTTTQFLKACSLSVALLGSAAVVLTVSLPDAAFAEKGNGGGNGGGNGNGGGKSNAGGNGGGNDNAGAKSGGNGKSADFSSTGKSAEKSKAAKKKAAKVAAEAEAPEPTEVGETKSGKIKLKHVEGDGIAHPSELGALNAAHANPRALENASPNSRVGRIAAYRNLVLEGQELAADLAEKEALLDTLETPRPLAEIDGAKAVADADVLAKTEAVTMLQEQIDAAAVSDPTLVPGLEAQLLAADTALSDAQQAAQDLADERAAAEAYQTLTDEIANLTEQLEAQPEVERDALEAAANKPVTDDVEAQVKTLLGLE